MKRESFDEVLDIMQEKSIIAINNLDFFEQTIDETFIREFNRHFPSLQFRIFSDHNDFCICLHEAIMEDLGVKVTSIRCVTSEALGENPAVFAHDYDAVTLDPIGIRYQVWLDFKKPMNLRPDACSLKLYAEQKDILRPYVFAGNEPEIPEVLIRGT